MTIIETMLEKTKSRSAAYAPYDGAPANGAGPAHGPGPHAGTQVAQPRRHGEIAGAPSTPIQPHRLAIDPTAARENRLLLAGGSPRDRGAMGAYGMLRTRLLQRARAKGWVTIGVTSASPQDGKSLTAVNLSLSIAREKNSTVVLLDLDMCNPTICHLLGISPPVELKEFLQQKSRSAHDLFVSIGPENLLLAGNTTAAENSAELLASARLEELLEFVKRSTSNPLVLIDLPPLVSPDDALVVAPRIDALLLVASEGLTSRAELQKALDLASGFRVAGLVLNRSTEMSRKYYTYGYGGTSTPHG